MSVVFCLLFQYSFGCFFFFFNDTATTEIYTLSLHDALPISDRGAGARRGRGPRGRRHRARRVDPLTGLRSEEHTSELQSQSNLVCRLLLEKKKKKTHDTTCHIQPRTRTVHNSD